MNGRIAAILAGAALCLGAGPAVAGYQPEPGQVIVVDRSDLQRLPRDDEGFRTSELVGVEVYGPHGEFMGRIEDFVLANGYLYALLDTRDGAIAGGTNLGDGEEVVIPWDQLREMQRPEPPATPTPPHPPAR